MPSVCVIITTFNRQKNILQNLRILSGCKSFIGHVYVVDNASNLPKVLNNSFITIIYNKNLGGSGGYARGIYEAIKNNKFTHIMLMDDDIKFEQNTIKNAIARLGTLPKDTWISFGMRTLSSPYKFYALSEKWNGIHISSPNRDKDMNIKCKIQRKKNIYAGWWSLIIPVSAIKKYGYPLPFFIKFDDIEYSLRCKPLILFDPKYSVLHESFDSKYNLYLEYYIMRNSLITNTYHIKCALIVNLARYIFRNLKFFLKFKYNEIIMTNKGVEDYLQGPAFFEQTNFEIYNAKIKKMSEEKANFAKGLFMSPLSTIALSFKMIFKYKKIKRLYLLKLDYLTSEEYWKKQFFN